MVPGADQLLTPFFSRERLKTGDQAQLEAGCILPDRENREDIQIVII